MGEGKSSSGICATRRMMLLETQGKVSHELCLRRRRRRGRREGEQDWPMRDVTLRMSNGGRERFVQPTGASNTHRSVPTQLLPVPRPPPPHTCFLWGCRGGAFPYSTPA